MKEFLKKKWYIILGLILLIASVVVSVILYIKLDECSNKKCEECETCEELKCIDEEKIELEEDDEEKPQVPEKDEDEGYIESDPFVSIVKATDFGVLYDYNDSLVLESRAFKDGYLTGSYYIEELKNTKFIGTAGVNRDVGPGQILALSEAGELYYLAEALDEGYNASYYSLKVETSGKITDLQNMLISSEDRSIPFYLSIPVLTVNGTKYVLTDSTGEMFFSPDENKTYSCTKTLEEFYDEIPIFTVGPYAYYSESENGLSYTGVYKNNLIKFGGSENYITDAYNSKAINVMYTIFTLDEEGNETLYIVSTDDKLYIINDVNNTKLTAYGNIEKVKYVEAERDESGYIISESKISIVLTSGEEFIFEEY